MLSEHGKFHLLHFPSCQTESVVSRTWDCNHEKGCETCYVATDYIFILTQVTNRTLKTSYALQPSEHTHFGTSKNAVQRTDISHLPIMHSNGSSSHCCLRHTSSLWAPHFGKLKSLWQNEPGFNKMFQTSALNFLIDLHFLWAGEVVVTCVSGEQEQYLLYPKSWFLGREKWTSALTPRPSLFLSRTVSSTPHIPFNLHDTLLH